jgi:hypothetical protein
MVFKNRVGLAVGRARTVTLVVLLAALPGAAVLPPLVGLTTLIVIVCGLIAFETARNADLRHRVRQ